MGDETTMSKPMTRLLAGAALTLAAAGAAFATEQTAQRQAAEDSQAAAKVERRADRLERREVRVYRQDHSHTDHLADILQLRPDQEPALKALLEATRGDSDRRDRMVKFDSDTDGSTLQRLDEMQARMAEQQAEAARKIAAIKIFYGQLDERQKKAFDAMPMLMMVGPSFGPMMIPHRMAIAHRMPLPPEPPEPPRPPGL